MSVSCRSPFDKKNLALGWRAMGWLRQGRMSVSCGLFLQSYCWDYVLPYDNLMAGLLSIKTTIQIRKLISKYIIIHIYCITSTNTYTDTSTSMICNERGHKSERSFLTSILRSSKSFYQHDKICIALKTHLWRNVFPDDDVWINWIVLCTLIINYIIWFQTDLAAIVGKMGIYSIKHFLTCVTL